MKRVLVVGEINVDLILQGAHAFPTPGKEVLVDGHWTAGVTASPSSSACSTSLRSLRLGWARKRVRIASAA